VIDEQGQVVAFAFGVHILFVRDPYFGTEGPNALVEARGLDLADSLALLLVDLNDLDEVVGRA
jgi:hypothetical protein